MLQQLANDTVSWPVQSDQLGYVVMAGKDDWIKKHPEVIERFLQALARAEGYVTHHPEEAKAILGQRLKFDAAYITRVWPQYQSSLSLDYSLLVAMTDEARWLIKNNPTDDNHVPNWLNYISEDGLKKVKPQALNIVR